MNEEITYSSTDLRRKQISQKISVISKLELLSLLPITGTHPESTSKISKNTRSVSDYDLISILDQI